MASSAPKGNAAPAYRYIKQKTKNDLPQTGQVILLQELYKLTLEGCSYWNMPSSLEAASAMFKNGSNAL